jgi:nucleotide-binding universal stress UspA family protein
MKILLAVDGSECALRAAEFLVLLAAGPKAHVDVVNVQAEVPYGELLSGEMRERVETLREERARKAAAPAMETLAGASIECRLHVLSGDPAAAIAQIARDLGSLFIVMGSRGLGSIGGLALGSVATRVIHLSDVPVTVVK